MPGPSNTTVGGGDEPPVDTEPPQRLSVDIMHESGDWSALGEIDAAVHTAAQAIAAFPELKFEPACVCIALASDATVRALNRDYRGFDKPTNVLSFPILAPASETPRHLGDVVLAAETVLAEANAAGVSPTHHVQHLVVHGVLHLLGYDHESSQQAAHMERLEVAILDQLGVADPYREDAN
jgi:probable rRNA maturation factor